MLCALCRQVWDGEAGPFADSSAWKKRLTDSDGDFESIMPIASVFYDMFHSAGATVVKFGKAKKDHVAIKLCVIANRLAGVVAATSALLLREPPNENMTAEDAMVCTGLLKDVKEAMTLLMTRMPASVGDAPSESDAPLSVSQQAQKALKHATP